MSARIYQIVSLVLLIGGSTVWMSAQDRQLTDKDITRRIDTELFRNADVPVNQIDVNTENGIVTLNGTLGHILAKERAEKIVGAVKGVRGIVNMLVVVPPMVSDQYLREAIFEALAADPATDAYDDIAVSADEGVVTLTGNVESWQEKQLAGYVAKGVRGIKELNNEINVQYQADRPDVEIAQEIKQAVENDIRLYDRLVRVSVEGGVVGLSGTVGSLTEKKLAESYAWTAGVTKVSTKGLHVNDWAKNEYLRSEPYPERSDAESREAVKATLEMDARIKFFDPIVAVNNEVVTLSGVVSSLAAKRAAERDAGNVIGVAYVRNNIKVRPSAIPEDKILKNRITGALKADPYIERYELEVTAWNGKIYLTGIVDNYFEKSHAEEIVASQQGVVDVVNKIEVIDNRYFPTIPPYLAGTSVPTGDVETRNRQSNDWISDAQLKENIEEELWWSMRVNQDEITVDVEQRAVTLSGIVPDQRAADIAISKAWQEGALMVIDELEIAEPK